MKRPVSEGKIESTKCLSVDDCLFNIPRIMRRLAGSVPGISKLIPLAWPFTIFETTESN